VAPKNNKTPSLSPRIAPDEEHLPLLLLVDDSDAIVALEKAALGSTYRLESAANGRLALELMQRHVPDGVLLDLSMPEMDGDEVLMAMRRDPRLREVPVLVISTESQRARDTLRLGADDFLPKPVTAEDLRRRVAGILEMGARRSADRLRAFLFFRAGDVDLGLPLENVVAVTARPALLPLLGAPKHVIGYFELYGEPVAVLDLALSLGRVQALDLLERKVVVVEVEAGAMLGLETDEVWDPEELGQSEVLSEEHFESPFKGLRGHLQCLARANRGLMPVLRVGSLLDDGSLQVLREKLDAVRSVRT
jgi:CheY-like chemotaxis protein